jgi:hypothetical protein
MEHLTTFMISIWLLLIANFIALVINSIKLTGILIQQRQIAKELAAANAANRE